MQKRTSFSIIVPTYREAQNLPHLVEAIQHVEWGGRDHEIIIVDDDSRDGTKTAVELLKNQYPNLRLIIRQTMRSLSQSVIDGCLDARYPILVTMDADLSHPVRAIPAMLDALESDNCDMVVGSRYVQGGSVDDSWPLRRRMLSRLCALVTKCLLRLSVNDPLAGFFAIKKSVFIESGVRQAFGWKIGLELMIKCRCKGIKEVPIHFSERRYGKSKLTLKVGFAFIKQLKNLVYFQMTKP